MTYYAVVDTNVVVSSMLKTDSIPWKIIDLIKHKIIIPILNEEILNEYFEVLTRNKFGFTVDNVNEVISIFKDNGIFVEKEHVLEDFIDKDDLVFFEIVMSARSTMDAYLVTGNIKHYPIRNYVVTPREMLEIITENKMLN